VQPLYSTRKEAYTYRPSRAACGGKTDEPREEGLNHEGGKILVEERRR
jgi:hypothetical protein